ncbi:helix-turn-helix domain-containing protein [Amycolatopsis rifamycinica]|uniref:HTH araC/xylS-type domain-containing protein n=1 Tax=Amycolatopsis rifamycinica TaxID=287986 RepID=A0A066TVK5_9PSEU|nr:helix-turn-helix domain-containing protein [Amycolatopsis rifamycinica]KDN17597.1 hypothetical protein DV20_35305 [Amycolatopsis rifamycinica]
MGSEADYKFFTARRPNRRLARWVNGYLAQDCYSVRPILRRVAAVNYPVIVIDLDPAVRRRVPGSVVPAAVSPVSGLIDRPQAHAAIGRERCVIVELTPLGARALFGRPLDVLANTSVGLADLLGRRADLLAEQLWEARSWPERFRVLDFWLSRWMPAGPPLPPEVQAAWQLMTQAAGRVKIGDLADQVGWTRQHLNFRFRREIGLSPKTVGRIIRLHRAIDLVSGPEPARWCEVAAACGYADQPHLNRDFRALLGCNPTELLRFDDAEREIYVGFDAPFLA